MMPELLTPNTSLCEKPHYSSCTSKIVLNHVGSFPPLFYLASTFSFNFHWSLSIRPWQADCWCISSLSDFLAADALHNTGKAQRQPMRFIQINSATRSKSSLLEFCLWHCFSTTFVGNLYFKTTSIKLCF